MSNNVKDSFVNFVDTVQKEYGVYVTGAKLQVMTGYNHSDPFNKLIPVTLCLDKDFSNIQGRYQEFLNEIDLEYDNGYGIQTLYGTIWFSGGIWASRCEYDGAENWVVLKCPSMDTNDENVLTPINQWKKYF